MITVTSISGGKTSAYLADMYPTDYNVFALVRTSDPDCKFPDKKLRRDVEDRINAQFVGTLEDDLIVTTIFDLEQHLGRRIEWVTGITFDKMLATKGGWLPNKLHRYCTMYLKIEPIFHWWHKTIRTPVKMHIGYRANETSRANDMLAKTNSNGFLEFEATFEKHSAGRYVGKNKWVNVPWQKPVFKLIENGIYPDTIMNHWIGKNVRFAEYNNCVHCFHRIPPFLRMMWPLHPQKMGWAKRQEQNRDKRDTWRKDMRYEDIERMLPGMTLFPSDFGPCDAGYCGL